MLLKRSGQLLLLLVAARVTICNRNRKWLLLLLLHAC